MVMFMENNVETPRYMPLELHVTPIRAASANVRVESPKWFEPAFIEDATVSIQQVSCCEEIRFHQLLHYSV